MVKLIVELPDHQYNNIMSVSSMMLGRLPYKGIICAAINAIKRGEVVKEELDDLIHENDDRPV